MGVLLAAASAITYGAADFFGGFATRRTSVFSVIVVSQLFGTTLLFAAMPFFLTGDPDIGTFVFGGLAGVAGALGVGLFYKGLSIGRMSVVAPTTAVLSAVFPVAFGLISGERPPLQAMAGVAIALSAVALISSTPNITEDEDTDPSPAHRLGLWHSLGAGTGFGLFFIFLAEAGDAGLWPLVGARLASVTVMVLGALVMGGSMRPATGTLPVIAGAGIFDVAANIFYLLAIQEGLLSVVAVVTSMYPASTVVLARVVLDERLYRLQALGLVMAAAGVSLIAMA